MARTKGLLPLSGNFEPQVAGPFDARSRVETKADLLLTATWQAKDGNPYTYVGMVVTVYADQTEGNNGIYRLKAADYTQEGNWEKAGAGATVDLNAIDTQLNTATVTETVTDNTLLYIIGKFKANALVLYNYIKTKLDLVYATINHNHNLADLSEKSYNSLSDKPTIPAAQVNADWNATEGVAEILNKPTIPTIPALADVATSGSYNDLSDKPTIPSIAGLMVESEYTGETGTKKVNYAKSAEEAEQAIQSYSAQQDGLGREIHTTYALKQSGVTPPEIFRVMLDDTTPTYTIEALTAENLIVENIATTGGKVVAPILVADKTLKITIQGNDTLLNGNTYEDGVTIFAIYEASAKTWTFNSILDPEVPDYSDMTVDIMLENPTVLTSIRNGILVAQFIHLNKYVFIRTHATAIGIYQCVGLYSGNAYLQRIAAGTALHTVRVKDGDVWYSQYDGKNLNSITFVRIGSAETGQTIRTKLEALTGDDKLQYSALRNITGSYTLDFRDDVTQIQDINIEGLIRIDEIQTINVATLQLGALTIALPLESPITVEKGAYNVWTITRNTATAASVGIKYTKL